MLYPAYLIKRFVRDFLKMACEEIRVPVTVGGGIKNVEQAKKY